VGKFFAERRAMAGSRVGEGVYRGVPTLSESGAG
jgi:hypothetical protein